MLNIFFEKKFLFHAETNRDKDYMTDSLADGQINGRISDVSAARDIMERLNSLRNDMMRSSVLTNEDQNVWNKKIEDVKEKPSHEEVRRLEEEFQKEQKSIKSMVTGYTAKLNANKDSAFAVDELKGINTIKEYMEWFMQLSAAEKEAAFLKIDDEIKERADLRKEILKLNPELKSEVVKMDRTAMAEKLKELDTVNKNVQKASFLLDRDKKYFRDIKAHLDDFKDMVPQTQDKWLAKYEEELLKPRKELFEKFESLPKELQDNEFYNLNSFDKKAFLEKMESKIENDFMRAVNEIPDSTWSYETKKFAIKEFFKAEGLNDKANRLTMLPEFIKAEKRLTSEYKTLREKLKNFPDYAEEKWERLSFEEKEEFLLKMEAETFMLKNFTNLLSNKRDGNVISEKTYDRIMQEYLVSTKENRLGNITNFAAMMKPRDELLKNFMSLKAETKNQFEEKFNSESYTARLELFKAASEYEAKNLKTNEKGKEQEHKEDMPQPLSSPELKAVIENLKMQADLYEEQGKIEQALGIHESIVKIDSKNTLSKEKIKELKLQSEALETANKAAKTFKIDQSLNNEIERLALLEGLIKDKENQIAKADGAEDAGKQTSHLGDDSFKHGIHKSIFKNTGGNKILGKDGKVKDIYTIDIDYFGDRQKSEIKKKQENAGKNQNLTETSFRDKKTGNILSFSEAKSKVEQRKQNAAKKMAEAAGINFYAAENDINERIRKAA